MISEHVLLPHTQGPLIFPELPLARLPFVTVPSVQVDMVELEYHGELLTFFRDVLACLILVYAAGHLADGAVGVFAQYFAVHFVHVFVDVGTALLSTSSRLASVRADLPIGVQRCCILLYQGCVGDWCIW